MPKKASNQSREEFLRDLLDCTMKAIRGSQDTRALSPLVKAAADIRREWDDLLEDKKRAALDANELTEAELQAHLRIGAEEMPDQHLEIFVEVWADRNRVNVLGVADGGH